MRRAAAFAALTCTGVALAGEPAPSAAAIRAARDAVYSRPEFRYDRAGGPSLVEKLWNSWTEFIHDFAEQHPIVLLVVWIGLCVMFVALVVHIVWTMRMARQAEWRFDAPPDVDAAMRRGDPSPFRSRAVEHAAAGRFDEAVRDLYAALLVALDRRGCVRYASHKALLDYRVEASRHVDAVRTLELFAATYHPGSFGRRPPDRAHFDGLLREFDRVAGTAP